MTKIRNASRLRQFSKTVSVLVVLLGIIAIVSAIANAWRVFAVAVILLVLATVVSQFIIAKLLSLGVSRVWRAVARLKTMKASEKSSLNAVDQPTSGAVREEDLFLKKEWKPRIELEHSFGPIPASSYNAYRKQRESIARSQQISTRPVSIQLADWDGDLAQRRIRLTDERLTIEIFGTPSVRKKLYVFLSAGGGVIKDGKNPIFQRASWHPWLDAICLNIDDPTFCAFPGKLQTGWYLGDVQQDAVPSVVAIIRRVQSHYAIEDDAVYVIGSSAGGTSALKIGRGLTGATVIAENPPAYPHERWSAKHLRQVGLDLDSEDCRSRNSLDHIFDHGTSQFFIIQNVEDRVVMNQLTKLLTEVGLSEPRFGLNEVGSLSLFVTSVPSISPHHAFFSVQEFQSVIRATDRTASAESRMMALDVLHEALRRRTLDADKASNLKGWAKLFANLDLPLLADLPLPTHTDVVRVSLRANSGVIYRMRLAHQAKFVSMDVSVQLEHTDDSQGEIQHVAESAGARTIRIDDGLRLSIAEVPLEEAPEKLGIFVSRTAALFKATNKYRVSEN